VYNVFDIILGDPWLNDTRAVLNFREGEATIYKKFKRFVVKALRDEPCPTINSDTNGTTVTRSPPLLTALQLKRSLRKTNAPAFIVHLKVQGAHTNADAPRPDGGNDGTTNNPYRTDGRVQPPAPIELESDLYYTIDDIVAHRTNKRGTKRSFLVKWSGYGHEHNSWVDERDVTSSVLHDYWTRYPDRRTNEDVGT
jgi:hypothetical protein